MLVIFSCVIPVLRERYLRNDVGCGVSGCRSCVQPAQVLLPSRGSNESKLFPDGHFVVPDTNVFLAQVLPLFTPQSHFLLSEDHACVDGSDGIDPLQPSGDPAPDSSGRGSPSLVAIVQPPQGFGQVRGQRLLGVLQRVSFVSAPPRLFRVN